MTIPLDDAALNTLFYQARTHSHWQPEPVQQSLLEKLYQMVALHRPRPTAHPVALFLSPLRREKKS